MLSSRICYHTGPDQWGRFVRALHCFSLPQALEHLGFDPAATLKDLHTVGDLPAEDLPWRQMAKRCSERPIARPEWAADGEAVLDQWQHVLWSPAGSVDLSYLRRERGLHDETIRAARLGLNPRPDGYVSSLRHAGRSVYVARGIVMPWLGVDGQLYGANVRRPVLAPPVGVPRRIWSRDRRYHPRYQALSGGRCPLFGRHTGAPYLLACDGELDAILAAQELAGHPSVDVVTLGGCQADPTPWLAVLLRYRAVLVAYDLDTKGKGNEGYARHWGGIARGRRARLPMDPARGKDLTNFVIRDQGDLRAWVGLLVRAEEVGEYSSAGGKAAACGLVQGKSLA